MGSSYGIIRNQVGRDTINFPDWQEFEKSILRDPEVHSIVRSKVFRLFFSVVFRVYRKIGRAIGINPPYDIPIIARSDVRIAILGGSAFRRCPDFILRGRKVAYLYDPTPPCVTTDRVVTFVEDVGISVLFVSHPTFLDRIQPGLTNCKVIYLSEAVDPDGYLPNENKIIDLLAYGRKLPEYHTALLNELPNDINYSHGWLDTREDLIRAIGSAKIVVNFPRTSVRNDIDVAMVTMHFYQAIAYKALILGHCPPIFKEIFGYDPMISVDHNNPCEQVVDLLSKYSDYQDLIEKNYQNLIKHHTFWHRWLAMKEILKYESDD